MRPIHLLTAVLGLAALLPGGCAIPYMIGGMAQNYEYQKQIETPPRYDGLVGQRVAVVVDADLETLYEYPDLVAKITGGVTRTIGREVPEARVVRPEEIVAWQWRTPQWNAMPYGQMVEELNVDRVVFVDIAEYRLNPPGNRWLWEGTCKATVGIIERDSFDPDAFIDSFEVVGSFPPLKELDRSGEVTPQQIEIGLLTDFVKRAGWLFYTHLEPKYPDKFKGEAQAKR